MLWASAIWLATLATLIFLRPAPVFAQLTCAQTQAGAGPIAVQSHCNSTYNSEERLKDYFRRTLGPRAHLASAAVAGIQQARNAPEAWRQGMEGYGRRYGSGLAKRGISNTVQLGVESMLGEDSRYFYSERGGFWPRMKHAVIHSLVVRDRQGGREVAVGRIAGTMAGGLLSRTWQPQGHRGIRNGLQSGGISFGGYIAGNLFREFTRGINKHLPF